MTRKRRPHAIHCFRVISRCPSCRARLLSGCSYKSRRGGACIAVRDDRPIIAKRHAHLCPKGNSLSDRIVTTNVLVVDLTREARRIFGDMIAPGIGIGVGE